MRSTWTLFFSGRFVIHVINDRRVPVMLGEVTLHALCEIDIGVILLCQMSRPHDLFVNIYIMCF